MWSDKLLANCVVLVVVNASVMIGEAYDQQWTSMGWDDDDETHRFIICLLLCYLLVITSLRHGTSRFCLPLHQIESPEGLDKVTFNQRYRWLKVRNTELKKTNRNANVNPVETIWGNSRRFATDDHLWKKFWPLPGLFDIEYLRPGYFICT